MPNDVEAAPSYGPAMAALNSRQLRFVEELLGAGDNNFTRAFLAAGYQGNGTMARMNASRLAHDPKILAAMHEEAIRRIHSGVILATSELLQIAKNGTRAGDRLKAISMILNRAGIHEISEHKVTVDHTSSTDREMIGKIKQLAESLGLDAQKLLGRAGVVDAEFSVIENEPEDISDIL